MKHSLNTGVHFFFLDELAPFGGGQSFLDGSQEPRLIVEIAYEDISHQSIRISTFLAGDLLNPGLLLRREMDFHGAQITPEHAVPQRPGQLWRDQPQNKNRVG